MDVCAGAAHGHPCRRWISPLQCRMLAGSHGQLLRHTLPPGSAPAPPHGRCGRRHHRSRLELHDEPPLHLESMKMPKHLSLLSSFAFWAISLVMAGFFLLRIWSIHLLFTDAALRAQTQNVLTSVAAGEGWL